MSNRRNRRRLAWAATLALSLCLGQLLLSSATASPQVISGPDPAVAQWPHWPHQVSCEGGLPFDPVAAFSGPTNAERGNLPSEKALRRELAHEAATFEPGYPLPYRHNWRLLAEGEGVAEFVAGRLGSGRLEWMSFAKENGAWRDRSSSSNCQPASLRRGLEAITWTLARNQHLGSRTRKVRVDLGPGECDDGRSQNARVQKPEFDEQNGVLLMSLWLRPVSPGFHTCLGAFEPPLVVRLPEPLGHRQLWDGGLYPPSP